MGPCGPIQVIQAKIKVSLHRIVAIGYSRLTLIRVSIHDVNESNQSTNLQFQNILDITKYKYKRP